MLNEKKKMYLCRLFEVKCFDGLERGLIKRATA